VDMSVQIMILARNMVESHGTSKDIGMIVITRYCITIGQRG